MSNLNLTATEIMGFIPAGKEYKKAIQFYVDIGFEPDWTSDTVSILKKDNCRFFLQNFHNEWAQDNFMMNLEVKNLDDWWKNLSVLDLEKKYEGVKLKAPEIYPWGKREVHLIDPCGVLWHISTPAL